MQTFEQCVSKPRDVKGCWPGEQHEIDSVADSKDIFESADTLISDFWPCILGKNTLLLA